MKIACIGGGPAGLYLGILVKRSAPEHEVIVYERNRPDDTFGFGVVFSDATLGHLAAADPESHAQITAKFARWDDIEIHVGGEVLTSTGHGFCGLERKTLLQILQARAQALGVKVEFEHPIKTVSDVKADVIVVCDGVGSVFREALAAQLQPRVDIRPNKFVWLGTTVPYGAFTFIFKQTPFGLFRVHAYRYQDKEQSDAQQRSDAQHRQGPALPDRAASQSDAQHRQGPALPDRAASQSDAQHRSTFIVECREDTWRKAGLEGADEDKTVEVLSEVFAEELGGHTLIKNRSIWRNFPTVRCGAWHAGNVVMLGDAVHTAHFSIGSGTKLAMEDAIILRDELLKGGRTIESALAAYEARRKPEVESLQAAAQASLEWFEGTERYMSMAPMQFTYSLMTRSLRVSHASVAKRDPHLARGVELLLAASAGVRTEPPPAPSALPLALGDRKARSRIAVAPAVPRNETGGLAGDDELVALGGAASAGAGLVVTPRLASSVAWIKGELAPRINTDEQAVAWKRVVEYVHGKGALIAARIGTAGAVVGALEEAVQRAAFADFDLLLLDPGDDPAAIEHLPALVAAARTKWRAKGWIAAAVHDRPTTRAAVIGHTAQLIRAGANLLWVSSAGDALMAGARLPAAPLADRLRNELSIATAVEAGEALLPDLDAAVGAGRADLVVVGRMPR